MAKFRVVGISFDHMHMGDLLRLVHDHPDAEIAGVFDPDRSTMDRAVAEFAIPEDRVFTDFDACMAVKPDLAILCAATADHARYTERLAKHGVHVFVEKPFAATVADARAMIAAMQPTGKLLAVNWPLRWVPSHVTAKRLIDQGMIGDVIEFIPTEATAGRFTTLLTRWKSPAKRWSGRSRPLGGTSARPGVAVCWTTLAMARRLAPGIETAKLRWR